MISVRICQLATALLGLGGLRIFCHFVWVFSRLRGPLLRLASCVFRRSGGSSRGPFRVLLFHHLCRFGSLLFLLPLSLLSAPIILMLLGGTVVSLIVKRGYLAGMALSWADRPELGGFGEVCVLVVELGRLWHDVAE